MSQSTHSRAVRQGLRLSLEAYRHDVATFLTPQGTTPWADHVTDTDNPHNVNKHDVLLGWVEDYRIAGPVEAQAGLRDDLYLLLTLLPDLVSDLPKVGDPPSIRTPTAMVQAVPDTPPEGALVITMTASPYAYRDSSPVGSFVEREYRVVSLSTDTPRTETLHVQNWESVDLPLEVGAPPVWLWQCRDHDSDGNVSNWSFPEFVYAHPAP